MAVSINWGSFKRDLGLPSRGLGLIQGRAHPCKNFMVVIMNYASCLRVSSE